jgi:hypothetical protein
VHDGNGVASISQHGRYPSTRTARDEGGALLVAVMAMRWRCGTGAALLQLAAVAGALAARQAARLRQARLLSAAKPQVATRTLTRRSSAIIEATILWQASPHAIRTTSLFGCLMVGTACFVTGGAQHVDDAWHAITTPGAMHDSATITEAAIQSNPIFIIGARATLERRSHVRMCHCTRLCTNEPLRAVARTLARKHDGNSCYCHVYSTRIKSTKATTTRKAMMQKFLRHSRVHETAGACTGTVRSDTPPL